MTFFNFWSFKS